jgi:excisionase family DNA binding protein
MEEAARRLGRRPVTVRIWAAARRIAKVKLGRRVLIPVAEVERLINENLTPALPERTRWSPPKSHGR